MSIPNTRRVYALTTYTVELRPRGWFFWSTYGEKEEKGPYSSVASVTLMLARQFLREILRRDAPHELPQ